ncbi:MULTISPECIES: phosphatidylserine decarboxylase family protein [Leeuwenhoekiella]|jgi:phosphatidylserine decarboxylase|uniref:phosphatidylserine decarboxylase family protein n=1 Tax=Leeuwenhoekiella TaxID=283735 RepID=UPI000C4559C6|nr:MULTISPECIES: phosphatidylserine decarboxylase family protein [Leeuwenhoekiella]MAO42876.1 phosphatidylserine decarboxylase family protein [Leeuwenhoekiella sp.]MBQ51134.1 phosphatidylserine decarboxylase family protein [Leeuwenhoekiella sp.]HBT09439.1 phosphatidylserine decarboxylase family protein [Leeuwenhoekiella sp.]HCW64121.1 phosphatidylserine decarboxylase family protein [Leeuwenhoekiella sp.]|tara:strand:+ start:864 stop:1517 length:654 start_codon:yes stop_codon:yes gene_type:complete
MFHKEGYTIIIITLLVVAIGFVSTQTWVSPVWLQYVCYAALTILLILILQFFRNPTRKAAGNIEEIVSPVDGKVVVIEEVFEKEYFKEKRLQVSIFMSPLNVHVTRYPAGGEVVYSKYHAGKYLVAWHPKASEENERTTVVVRSTTFGDVLYRQIAGALAKRIVNYAKEGETVIQGDDSGFIKFGSRVDVFLPLDTPIAVKLNQKVKGAQSVIATLK